MVTEADQLRRLVRARAAVFCLFASFGLVTATWAVHLPSVKQTTGISTSLLGVILLMLGAGALVGMQVSGKLVDRFGSGPVGVLGVAGMALALLVPLAAGTWPWAAAGAVLLGFATGTAEVGMNAAAVDVERDYGRPIMAAFHAVFSIGTVLGALLGAAGFALAAGVFATGLVIAVIALVVVGLAAVILLRRRTPSSSAQAEDAEFGDDDAPPRRRVVILGVLAFLLLMAEGSAMDWSSLHAQQHLGASPSIGSLALGGFVAAMTVVRFTIDRIVERVGPVQVVRWCASTAAAGFAIVMASPFLALTLVGWVVVGLGLSGGVPQVFTAAGNVGGGSGRVLSRVVGTGYLAVLAGPGVIGWLADCVSLNTAFALPLCGVLICAGMARAVAPRR
ncbi:MFS transporter [Mycolicibacterium komossense]|uniref:MFS transporter n=1 Tax=Mycolicibacterium komossense TaxID=1779 RepID=A0ABT3CEI8_9MYCO|nr:MFS transporter [Mycolicibacterium komossense]MCV7227901.1 MFS transporter [Mycolicibacterium komossense]